MTNQITKKSKSLSDIYFKVSKLKNAFPHGCPEWKEFTKIKTEIRKLLWLKIINKSHDNHN